MTATQESLDVWLAELDAAAHAPGQTAERRDAGIRLHMYARKLADAMIALPAGQYRSDALCKLQDAIVFAHIAARQDHPPPPQESTP